MSARIVKVFLSFVLFIINIPQVLSTEILQFESGFSISIDIPENWQVTNEDNIQISEMERSYTIGIRPSTNEMVSFVVTIGVSQDRLPLTSVQFDDLVGRWAEFHLSAGARNENFIREVTINELKITNGNSKYYLLNIPEGEWNHLLQYFANYSNGFIVVSTFLYREKESVDIQLILNILSSIIPRFIE